MLDTIDLTLSLEKSEYREQLLEQKLRLRRLAFELYKRKRGLILVVEGWDAAGKGGSIRRITGAIDPRGYHIYSIKAPSGDDATHHYLWRFWRRLLEPEEKQIVIFDRSWYGRVLVERVENFATEVEWRKAFREINEFEHQLTDANFIIVKFWFHISKDEQIQRFEARRNTPHKAFKLTDEDWRNRAKWDEYTEAATDMLLKTSTLGAPWTIIEGDNKYYARVKAIRTLADQIESEVGSPTEKKNGEKGKKRKKK